MFTFAKRNIIFQFEKPSKHGRPYRTHDVVCWTNTNIFEKTPK